MAVTLRGGDRFRVIRQGPVIHVERARKGAAGWARMHVVVDPKKDLRWGPLKSFRHFRQALGDALGFGVTSALRVGEPERKGVQFSDAPVVRESKAKPAQTRVARSNKQVQQRGML